MVILLIVCVSLSSWSAHSQSFSLVLSFGCRFYSRKSLRILPPLWDSSQKIGYQLLCEVHPLLCLHHICSFSTSSQPGETFFSYRGNVLLWYCSSYILDESATVSLHPQFWEFYNHSKEVALKRFWVSHTVPFLHQGEKHSNWVKRVQRSEEEMGGARGETEDL